MTDSIPCRWPACEDDTDCMNGCKPAPTASVTPLELLKRAEHLAWCAQSKAYWSLEDKVFASETANLLRATASQLSSTDLGSPK